MDIKRVLIELKQQRRSIDKAIAALQELQSLHGPGNIRFRSRKPNEKTIFISRRATLLSQPKTTAKSRRRNKGEIIRFPAAAGRAR